MTITELVELGFDMTKYTYVFSFDVRKWFREEHDIDIVVEPMIGAANGFDKVYTSHVLKLRATKEDFTYDSPYVYDTYEEAEEWAIQKTIEIIKEKLHKAKDDEKENK